MDCKHERIKSENCVISCIDCGAILPIDYLVAKDRVQKPAETPVETAKEPDEAPKATKKRTTTKRGAK